MLITYTSRDEVLVTTTKREKEMVAIYFDFGMSRDLDDYNRVEHPQEEAIAITTVFRVW